MIYLLILSRSISDHHLGLWGENSSCFTNEQSPQGGAFSRDLLDQKSKSPLFPGAGGLRDISSKITFVENVPMPRPLP